MAIVLLLMMTVAASGGAYAWIGQVQGEATDRADRNLATALAVRDVRCDVSNVTLTLSNTGDRALVGEDADLYVHENGRLVASMDMDIGGAGFAGDGGVGTVSGLLNTSLDPAVTHRVRLAVPDDDLSVEVSCRSASSSIDGRWRYRRALTVTENAGQNLGGYQVNWTVDTASLIAAGKMNASCNDIRIWDPVHGTLPVWVESGCNTANTMLWTEIPSLPASGQRTLYLYYGALGAASDSDPGETMLWYDHFDTEQEDAYQKTEHASRGNLTNGGWVWETGSSRIRGDSTSNSDLTITTHDREIDASDDILIRVDYLFANDNDGSGITLRDGTDWWVGSISDDHGCSGIGHLSGGNVNCLVGGGGSYTVSSPYTFRLASHDGMLRWWVNDTLVANYSQSITVDGVGLLNDAQDGPAYFDRILARRYVDPAPSVIVGAEERIETH